MFDVYGGAGPFALVGMMNVCVLLLAIVVRIKSPGAMPLAAGVTKAGAD